MRAKNNMHKTIDSQRTSEQARVTESICICHSFDQILNTNASWTIDKGSGVYTYSYASRFPFPPLWWWWLLFKGSKRRCQLYAWGSRKGLLSYLLTYSAASARIEYQRGREPSACWVRRRISRISSTMIQLVGDLLTCCFECQHFASASSMS